MEVWKMNFLFNWVIFRFQPLIFRGLMFYCNIMKKQLLFHGHLRGPPPKQCHPCFLGDGVGGWTAWIPMGESTCCFGAFLGRRIGGRWRRSWTRQLPDGFLCRAFSRHKCTRETRVALVFSSIPHRVSRSVSQVEGEEQAVVTSTWPSCQ